MHEIQPTPPPGPADGPASRGDRLRELAALFLRLGTTAFGGPAAHIALMQDELVSRRGWLTASEFLDMLAATNFIPGPNSTEMAIHIGYRRAGWAGLVVAGACFILPAALMCAGIAALYVHYGSLPVSTSMLWGVKPVVIAVVLQALAKLGKATVRTVPMGLLAVAAVAALFVGVHELVVLFGAGLLTGAVAAARWRPFRFPLLAVMPVPLATAATVPAAAMAAAAAPAGPLFLVFLKIGSVLFGSGYVLLAFLRADLVQRRHWLTEAQLLDAIAVGQVTPGPVFTTATFVGYVAGGGPVGALAATAGIFLPAFFFVAVSAPLLPLLRRSTVAGAFLNGLNVASLALMAVVTLDLARATFWPGGRVDLPAAGVAAAAVALLIWRRVNSAWLVLAGAVLGVARAWLMPAV